MRSQVIDALEAQEIKESGNEEGQHCSRAADQKCFLAEAHVGLDLCETWLASPVDERG